MKIKKIIIGLMVVVVAVFSFEFMHSKESQGNYRLKDMFVLQTEAGGLTIFPEYQGRVVYVNAKKESKQGGNQLYSLLREGKLLVVDFSQVEVTQTNDKKQQRKEKVKKHKQFTSGLMGIGIGLTQNLALVYQKKPGELEYITYNGVEVDHNGRITNTDVVQAIIRDLHADIKKQLQ